jgi:nitrogen regulatory protein P-II 1
MKKIEAILKPFKVEAVKQALGKLGIDGMTLSEVKALERPKARGEIHHNGGAAASFLPEVKIEVVVSDGHAPAALAAVIKNGKTGRGGDWRVFVSDVEQVVRIRTEEWNEAAI